MENTTKVVLTSPEELRGIVNNAIEENVKQIILSQINKEPKGKEVLTRKETSELFSISLVTIHDWVNRGIIKPYKVGNRTFFKRSELMEVLSSSNRS